MNDTINDDNSEFMATLNRACGLQFHPSGKIGIDSTSFAVNERPYDVAAIPGTILDSEVF